MEHFYTAGRRNTTMHPNSTAHFTLQATPAKALWPYLHGAILPPTIVSWGFPASFLSPLGTGPWTSTQASITEQALREALETPAK